MISGSPQMQFASRLIYLGDHLIDFSGRPYLPAIYASTARNLVVASRQVEKSTFLVLTVLYLAAIYPGIQLLYVCPRQEQKRLFARTRVIPFLADSPLLSHVLAKDRPNSLAVMNMQFANRSSLFVRAAYYSADAVRGISAYVLLVDECQDVAAGDLPVLRETLSHSPSGRTILCGTPKLVDNHLEAMFNQSTANEWKITCPGCGCDLILDEHAIGPGESSAPNASRQSTTGPAAGCRAIPGTAWGDGFWIDAEVGAVVKP